MVNVTFEEFEAAERERGFDEVLVRSWGPDAVVETHTHDFAVEAIVVEGEMWLTCGPDVRHLRAGDKFELDYAEPHAERYGPDGATYWAARRNTAPAF